MTPYPRSEADASSWAGHLSWQRSLATNSIGAVLIAVLNSWYTGNWNWGYVREWLMFALTYSNTIGMLAMQSFIAVAPRITRAGNVARWCAVLVVLTVCTAAGTVAGTLLLAAVGLFQFRFFWRVEEEAFRFCLPIAWALGISIFLFETVRERLHQTSERLKTQQLERERAEKLATEARLSSLQSRIHPHFLFNALNSISSLIREDPDRAERLIERMASLLRFSLDTNELGLVSLDRELKIVCDYLEIEKARFGGRLTYSIDVPDVLRQHEIPPMSIQTLVENSVKYAVAPRREGGTVMVSAVLEGESLKLRICDDGSGFAPDAILKGHGLDLLQSRLEAMFGQRARLQIMNEGKGACVVVRIPAKVEVAV